MRVKKKEREYKVEDEQKFRTIENKNVEAIPL